MLAEIGLRRGLDSVAACPEINAVHVKLEDLLLGKCLFDPQRDHGFQDFPVQSASTQGQTVPGQLLSDAAGSFLGRTAQNIVDQGSGNTAPIDPRVIVKTGILAGQQSLNKQGRNFTQ